MAANQDLADVLGPKLDEIALLLRTMLSAQSTPTQQAGEASPFQQKRALSRATAGHLPGGKQPGGKAGATDILSGVALAMRGGPIAALVQAIIGEIHSKVKLGNPAAAQRFEQASDDMSAVLGRSLAPLLETVTDLFRAMGDALTGLEPLIKLNGEMLRMVANSPFGLVGIMKKVNEFFGLTGKSVGAAQTGPARIGDVEDIQKQAILKVLEIKSLAEEATKTNVWLERIFNKLAGLGGGQERTLASRLERAQDTAWRWKSLGAGIIDFFQN